MQGEFPWVLGPIDYSHSSRRAMLERHTWPNILITLSLICKDNSMSLRRARRALDAGTLVTDFNTSSFSILQSLAKLWNKCRCAVSKWIELTYSMTMIDTWEKSAVKRCHKPPRWLCQAALPIPVILRTWDPEERRCQSNIATRPVSSGDPSTCRHCETFRIWHYLY